MRWTLVPHRTVMRIKWDTTLTALTMHLALFLNSWHQSTSDSRLPSCWGSGKFGLNHPQRSPLPWIFSFIQQILIEHLLCAWNCSSAGDTAVNKNFCLHRTYILVRRQTIKKYTHSHNQTLPRTNPISTLNDALFPSFWNRLGGIGHPIWIHFFQHWTPGDSHIFITHVEFIECCLVLWLFST